MERGIYSQQAGDFARHLFNKMSWVSQSQQIVMSLGEVFRDINVSGNGFLTKMDVLQGLADNFGDMGFSESEWESMFSIIETNQEDGYFNFEQFVFGVAAYQRGIN